MSHYSANLRRNLASGLMSSEPRQHKQDGGEGGIRTPDTVARMPHFECGAFNHSATSPGEQAGCGACVEHEPRKCQCGREARRALRRDPKSTLPPRSLSFA